MADSVAGSAAQSTDSEYTEYTEHTEEESVTPRPAADTPANQSRHRSSNSVDKKEDTEPSRPAAGTPANRLSDSKDKNAVTSRPLA